MTDKLFQCPWCGGMMDEEHPRRKEAADEMHEREADANAQVVTLTTRVAELEEALIEIERTYYTEGKDAGWRAAHMAALARKASEGADA